MVCKFLADLLTMFLAIYASLGGKFFFVVGCDIYIFFFAGRLGRRNLCDSHYPEIGSGPGSKHTLTISN